MVGSGLDLRNDTTPVRGLSGDYFTETVTAEAARWVSAAIREEPARSTFAYLAHQSNHGPLQVPQRYIDGECVARIPPENPSRRIICGMMRAVDSSLANMTALYQSLGAWEHTVVFFSTDNVRGHRLPSHAVAASSRAPPRPCSHIAVLCREGRLRKVAVSVALPHSYIT
jgi:hypothetical protein